MNTENKTKGTSLKIVREFESPVEKVYAAWTKPEAVVQWMGPGPITCKDCKVDLKVGGTYLIHMVGEDGDHKAVGVYKEIVPNKKLQFTWSWENQEMPETLVTLEFKEKGGKTEFTLIHEGFPVPEAAEKHNQGWLGCVAKLEAYLAGEVLTG